MQFGSLCLLALCVGTDCHSLEAYARGTPTVHFQRDQAPPVPQTQRNQGGGGVGSRSGGVGWGGHYRQCVRQRGRPTQQRITFTEPNSASHLRGVFWKRRQCESGEIRVRRGRTKKTISRGRKMECANDAGYAKARRQKSR